MDTGKLTLFLLGIVILMLAFVAASVLGFKPCTNECGGSSITGQTGGTAYYAPNETGRTIQTSGGNVLDASSALGRPSTYVDTGGRTRGVNCYAMEYCVETPTCEEECVQEGNQCGYGQSPLTNLAASTPFYGDCCDGTACRDGYCRRDECVPDGRLCQYGPTGERDTLPYNPGTYTSATNINTDGTNAAGANTNTAGTANNNMGTSNYNSIYRPTYYGECCGNSQCMEGYCTPQQECIEQGATCGYGQTTVTALVPATSNYYGQCCNQMACVDGTCQPPEEQCNERGQFCGYGPQTFTANYQNPAYYGDCCGDDQCVNGYCSPPAQNCVQTAGTCGYGTQYATTAAPAGSNYYGTCCEGDYCANGRCTPNQGCSGQGQTCAYGQISCCEGYECMDGRCVTPCEQNGGTCAYDSDCCQGSWCKDGKCSSECTATEGGSCLAGRKECCAGMSCSNSRCVVPCKREGSCEKTSDCCDGYYCSENKVCTRSTTTCATSGSCAVGAAVCCDGYYCNDNLVCMPEQTCGGYGTYCTSTADCCSPYYCGQTMTCTSATGAP
ncbi:hypothetical protein H0O01_01035 [Candidatus Micrarchaeota archaeon]|nr:hypothetical protein [Candidatus Micrarchaeota archaeon]